MRKAICLVFLLDIFAFGIMVMEAEAQMAEKESEQKMVTEVVLPNYISPSELVNFLGTIISD